MEKIFDTQEKWNAFIELSNERQIIIQKWRLILKEAVIQYFTNIDIVDGWAFYSSKDGEAFKWYLTEIGEESISLVFNRTGELILCCDSNLFYFDEIAMVLKSEKYKPLIEGINYLSTSQYTTFPIESIARYFVLHKHVNEINYQQQFAWKAGNETEKIVTEIAKMVNRVRKDSNLTQLLSSLNTLKKTKNEI
jgi:hypothetical protein